jgi:hypothetical protein
VKWCVVDARRCRHHSPPERIGSPVFALVRAWQAVRLLGAGGLLEAVDERGRMAASFLSKPALLALLARVQQEAATSADREQAVDE